jgi:hypothetical protein
MSHSDHVSQPQALQDWQRMLHWNATSHGWIAETDDFFLFVPENIYEREVKAYLTSHRIEWKTYSDIMCQASEAWQRQCDAQRTFQANLEQWLMSSERGIRIVPRNEEHHRCACSFDPLPCTNKAVVADGLCSYCVQGNHSGHERRQYADRTASIQ